MTQLEPFNWNTRYYDSIYEDQEVYKKMVSCKSYLLRNFPFFGIIASPLTLVEVPDTLLKTAATDKRHIYYNSSFMKSLTQKQKIFVVLHEILHCVLDHVGKTRKLDRNYKLWNKAADFVVNQMAIDTNIGEFPSTFVIDGETYTACYDPKYNGWSTDKVYEDLLKNDDDNFTQMDVHLDIKISDQHNDDNEHKIIVSGKEYEKIQKSFEMSVRQGLHAQRDAEIKNSVDNHIYNSMIRIVGNLITPKVNWRTRLRRYTTSTILRGYSFSNPNQKHFSNGIIIPGFRTKKQSLKEIYIAIDTSGSISHSELKIFISELQGILKSFDDYTITTLPFDGNVYYESIKSFSKHDSHGIESLIKPLLNGVTGGGATNFIEIFNYLENNKIKPKLLIFLTDGYPSNDNWGNSKYCPTIFLIVGDSTIVAPFGVTIHYNDD